MADWSTLPCDILGLIVLKFEDIADCVCFKAVCHSFNHAYTTVKEMSQLKILPWLFLAENKKENPECFRTLFSLSTNMCYQLSLPETFGRRCWGSNYGWIVTLGCDLEMHLFNPLTKACISLPSPSTLPTFTECIGQVTFEWLRTCYVTKATVLRIPDDFVVMVAYDEGRVAFARLGDQVWTPVQGPKFNKMTFIEDFCYWDDKILIIYGNGRLGYCDISSSSPHVRDLLPAPPSIRGNKSLSTIIRLYLVNSKSELLIVRRYKEHVLDNDISNDAEDRENDEEEHETERENDEEGHESESDSDSGSDSGSDYEVPEGHHETYHTREFAVFRPNFHTKEWTKIDDLEDVALFVGDSHSTSRNILNSHNCVRNRIYFTDDEMEFWNLPRELGGHDMGAVDIGDKDMNIIPYYSGGDFHSNFCTPIWFTPSI